MVNLSAMNKPNYWIVKEGPADSGFFTIDFIFNICDDFP